MTGQQQCQCGKPLGDDFMFHMVASPNADALVGQYRGFPRYSIHREHMRQADSWDWEVLCKACYETLPCAPSGEMVDSAL